jgi:hypothetical protein
MKKILAILLTVALISCNTFVLTPAKKRIKGKWTQVSPKPNAGVDVTWEFKGGELTIYTDKTVVDSSGNVLMDTTLTYSTSYEVKNKITRHVLIAEVGRVIEWVITKINKKELHISSLDRTDGPNRKSNVQYDFVKK